MAKEENWNQSAQEDIFERQFLREQGKAVLVIGMF